MIDLNSLSLYDVLDVDARATVEEIKRAYQIAQKSYGRGHMATYGLFTETERLEILRGVQGAYGVLIDPERRRQYDEELRMQGKYPTRRAAMDPARDERQSPLPMLNVQYTQKREDLDEGRGIEERVQEILASVADSGTWSGQLLRQIREIRGLSLDEIAQRTKVSRGHLRSLEEDTFDYLPPDVYVRGFIAQISKVLGLDPELTTSRFMAHIRVSRGAR